MNLNRLYRWGDYQYLATIDVLYLFDRNGMCIGTWFINTGDVSPKYYELINLLSDSKSMSFKAILVEWWSLISKQIKATYESR